MQGPRAGAASTWPIDGAGAAGAVDAHTPARPQLLGRRQTNAGAHSPLENRHTAAGFPHRQQAAAVRMDLPKGGQLR